MAKDKLGGMSSDLTSKKCVPCEIGTPPLTLGEFESLLQQLKLEWEVIEGKKIRHEFKFADFGSVMKFVNKVADLAESENHHPNIHIYYNRVVIDLTTHNIKGLSENDFIMAAKIENI